MQLSASEGEMRSMHMMVMRIEGGFIERAHSVISGGGHRYYLGDDRVTAGALTLAAMVGALASAGLGAILSIVGARVFRSGPGGRGEAAAGSRDRGPGTGHQEDSAGLMPGPRFLTPEQRDWRRRQRGA